MRKILNTWKTSLFATLLIILVSLLNIFFDDPIIECVSFWATIVALLLILFSLTFLLTKREWKHTRLSSIFLIISITFLYVYSFLIFWVYQSRLDKFADHLKIPQDIDLHIPQYLGKKDSTIKHSIDFELYPSDQPGLYEYNLWIGKIDSGIVYLKAFEVTQDYQLSKESLLEKSSILVYNPTDSILQFGIKNHFTIYEGDWGKPYAARFELWYKSLNDHSEKKLFEKIYKIEGWQR